MDITQLFKACVKTVRLRNKYTAQADKNRILKNIPKNEFTTKANDICYQITQLRNFLIENRAAYMKFACHLKRSAQMSDEERDLIDRESEKIISICTQLIIDFKLETQKKKVAKQFSEHMNAVLELLNVYLKGVYHIYNVQKQYRIKRDLETYKLLKLESDKKLYPSAPQQKPDLHDSDFESDTEVDNDPQDKQSVNSIEKRKKIIKNKLSLDDEISNNQLVYEQDELSAEDIQMFESENIHLFNELKGLSEEVEQIEKNVVDIAKLQEIFTEKVTLQKHDIERIANTVVGATENVKDANEQIKQAIQRNAGLRVYILFFLIVMSFSLLFLDWYND